MAIIFDFAKYAREKTLSLAAADVSGSIENLNTLGEVFVLKQKIKFWYQLNCELKNGTK